MVVLRSAVLSLLVPSAVLARGISHEKLHKRHDVHVLPSAAPYPTSNSTVPAQQIATGAAPTITKTIDVVPVPVNSDQAGSSPAKAGDQGKAAVGGNGANGNGNGDNGNGYVAPAECGPATITVTAPVKTVTVTAGAAAPPSSTPAKKEGKAKAAAATPAAQPVVQTSPEAQQPQQNSQPAAPKVAEKLQQPATNDQPSSAPSAQPSSSPKSSPSGLKKGILYADIATANAMGGGIQWGCNWDSSPIPAIGHASGQLGGGMEFVPQLWGPEDVHTSIWSGNSKGAAYVMAFNEPNQPKGAGGCGPMGPSDAIAPYEQYLKPNKDAGQKIISPCVSNDAHEWIDTFISATSLKPDALCFHWYGNNLSELQAVVATFAAIQSKHGIAELWLTEFALHSDIGSSDAKSLFQWLDSQSGVDRYAYNNHNLVTTPGVHSAYCS